MRVLGIVPKAVADAQVATPTFHPVVNIDHVVERPRDFLLEEEISMSGTVSEDLLDNVSGFQYKWVIWYCHTL